MSIPKNPADFVLKSAQKKKQKKHKILYGQVMSANLNWVTFTQVNYLQYQNSKFYGQKCGKHASVWWSNSLRVNTHSHSLLCTYTNSVDRKTEQLTLVSGSLIWRHLIGTNTPAVSWQCDVDNCTRLRYYWVNNFSAPEQKPLRSVGLWWRSICVCVCVYEYVFTDRKVIAHNRPKCLYCTDTVATPRACELGHYLPSSWWCSWQERHSGTFVRKKNKVFRFQCVYVGS